MNVILLGVLLALALYGLLALLTHTVPPPQPSSERFGGVIDTRTDRSLGCLHPELRQFDQAVRGALASVRPIKEPQ